MGRTVVCATTGAMTSARAVREIVPGRMRDHPMLISAWPFGPDSVLQTVARALSQAPPRCRVVLMWTPWALSRESGPGMSRVGRRERPTPREGSVGDAAGPNAATLDEQPGCLMRL